jgi:hypothetical protein
MTPAKHVLQMSLPLEEFLASVINTVNDAFTVLEYFTGVNNIAEAFLTSVNNPGKAILDQCQ